MEAENTKYLLLNLGPHSPPCSQDSGTWPWYAYLKQELEKKLWQCQVISGSEHFQERGGSLRGDGRAITEASTQHQPPAVLAVGKLRPGMDSGPNKNTFMDDWTLDLISHPSGNGKFTKDLQ